MNDQAISTHDLLFEAQVLDDTAPVAGITRAANDFYFSAFAMHAHGGAKVAFCVVTFGTSIIIFTGYPWYSDTCTVFQAEKGAEI